MALLIPHLPAGWRRWALGRWLLWAPGWRYRSSCAAWAGQGQCLQRVVYCWREETVPCFKYSRTWWHVVHLAFQKRNQKKSYPPRLVFPTLQRNESPFTLMGQWLSTLGRKIGSASEVQDIVISYNTISCEKIISYTAAGKAAEERCHKSQRVTWLLVVTFFIS